MLVIFRLNNSVIRTPCLPKTPLKPPWAFWSFLPVFSPLCHRQDDQGDLSKAQEELPHRFIAHILLSCKGWTSSWAVLRPHCSHPVFTCENLCFQSCHFTVPWISEYLEMEGTHKEDPNPAPGHPKNPPLCLWCDSPQILCSEPRGILKFARILPKPGRVFGVAGAFLSWVKPEGWWRIRRNYFLIPTHTQTTPPPSLHKAGQNSFLSKLCGPRIWNEVAKHKLMCNYFSCLNHFLSCVITCRVNSTTPFCFNCGNLISQPQESLF